MKMVSIFLSRLVILIFGALFPAYHSYKVVKGRRLRDYVRWTMYWIVFALFLWIETLTDVLLFWLPFYYELKIVFVIWLLSPYTRGATILYKTFIHPTLTLHEEAIDDWLDRAFKNSLSTAMDIGKKALLYSRTITTSAFLKVQEQLLNQLRHFYALNEKLLSESDRGLFTDSESPSKAAKLRAMFPQESQGAAATERIWQGFYTNDGSIIENEFPKDFQKLLVEDKQRWPNYKMGAIGCSVE
ncbi:unnamed protein product [Soboliphyme baturini]|uniref:Receptor expression-enhancing protein n=1 Tax=Soboliphyme baturini TaxID=241478 RepID=A0A183J899_9BILA|nr:unnamed protein product [Soboliphyme baturini]